MSAFYRRVAEGIERSLFPADSVGPLPLILLVVTLVAYWPAVGNGFVRWDEQLYVTENPFLSDPHGLWKGWTTIRETERQYYPLLLTTYWFEHRLWGDNPAGYHVVNIWLHLCNSLLVLLLLRALGAGRWASGVGAFLFALHPIQVESVVWVAELKNLQMGFFYLAAFLLYLYHRSVAPASGRGHFVKEWAAYGGVLLLYACALLSKVAAVTLPLSLFLADWLLVAPRDRRWWRGSLARVAPMFLMGIVPSLIAVGLEEGPAPGAVPAMVLRPFVASAALWFYLGKLAAPFSLTPIYPRWDLSAMRFWLLLAAAGLGGIGILLWHWRRRVPPVAAWGMGHFVATLSPVLGLIPFGYLDYSFVADHFVYLASIGFFVVVAVGLERVADGLARRGVRSGRWLATGLVCLALAGYIGAIRMQIPIWHDPMSFWTYLEGRNPRSTEVHNNLGNAYFRQNRFAEALEHYRAALQLKPTSSIAHLNVGLVLAQQGRVQEAIEEYRQALISQPRSWQAYSDLMLAYARMERFDEAIGAGERAIEFARPRGRTQDVDEITQLIQSYREKLAERSTDHDHHHPADDEEMAPAGGRAPISPDELALQVPINGTYKERMAFSEEWRQYKSEKDADKLRPLYERYIDVIGANGILDTIQTLRPTCHWEGHPLGRVIYAKLRRLGLSLLTCQDACNSGCMHGVIMEAFTEAFKGAPRSSDAHAPSTASAFDQARTLEERIQRVCEDPGVARIYKKGDCSHGVGHALTTLADYDIRRAVDQCEFFAQYGMQYYCATGAYMEYVTHHDQRDSRTRSLFYPCDEGDYPAACFRYKMGHVVSRYYAAGRRNPHDLIGRCLALNGKFRLGCFHGIGNGHMGFLSKGQMSLEDICGFGTDQDQYVCIDGAVERLAKYYPDKARQACEKLIGWRGELCRTATERNMYSLTKSFELYAR